jgi:uncharacterized protein YjbI with pentapeptide repeats
MRESAADHSTVIAVLAAFIREKAYADSSVMDLSTLVTQQPEPKPATDVQAALTVLARRPERPEPDYLDLSHVDLRGADLRWARLEGAKLESAWLHYANLSSANLKKAFLRGAQFQHAWLVETELDDADLIDAQLEKANLGGAQLRNANLSRAQLRKTHLRNANLQYAFLAGACLEDAYLVDAQLQYAHLAGYRISGRVNMRSIGYHPEEKEQDEDIGGADLRGANLTRAQLHSANLAIDRQSGKQIPAQGLTAAQLAQAIRDESTLVPNSLPTSLPERSTSPSTPSTHT